MDSFGGHACLHLSKGEWRELISFDLRILSLMQKATSSGLLAVSTSGKGTGWHWRELPSVTLRSLREQRRQREGMRGAGQGRVEGKDRDYAM
jgi:hypothetical protein